MHFSVLKTKKIAILGLGREGLSTAAYFLKHQIPFTLFDEKDETALQKAGKEWKNLLEILHKSRVPMVLGKPFTKGMFLPFTVIIRSPGMRPSADLFQAVKQEGVQITSQTNIFLENCPAKTIGVTGTKGKGTTASLIYEMLKKSGKDAYIGGNIGLPPLEFLDTLTTQSFVVLELSSYQLQDLSRSPHIAVMLMVTSEHLLPDREGSLQNYHPDVTDYIEAKRNIVRFQTVDDMAILNTDYPATEQTKHTVQGKIFWVSRYSEVATGCFVRDNKIVLRHEGLEREVIDVYELQLPGKHNFENVCAATLASYKAGVSLTDIQFILRTFKGLEHRLELIREKDGVRYYDDSFSTVPETTIAAIQAFSQPEILILGGSSKNSDFTQLGKVIGATSNIKAIIGIGIEWRRIKASIIQTENNFQLIEGLTNMHEIVTCSQNIAEKGDVVLLSPACASFDMFQNYKERGNQFKEQVNLL